MVADVREINVCALSDNCRAKQQCPHIENHKKLGISECILLETDGDCDQKKRAIIKIEIES
jgi:hypothetical protein